MTNTRSGIGMGQQSKTAAINAYCNALDRTKEFSSKQTEKGNAREEDAITMLSLFLNTPFIKNKKEYFGEYKKGTPDIVHKGEHTFDTKCCWSLHSYLEQKVSPLKKDHYWQGMGYMDLTGCETHTVALCLLNATESLIEDEKRKAMWRIDEIDPESSPTYKEMCRQIERNMIFDLGSFMKEYPHYTLDNDPLTWRWDIPVYERIHLVEFKIDSLEVASINKRAIEARKWIADNLVQKDIAFSIVV